MPKRPLEPQPNALVVGASSGIGAELAKALAHKGYNVALVARREAKLAELAEAINRSGHGKACIYTHNVTKYEEVPALFQQITSDLGGLDLIAYVAGVMPSVAANEYNFDKDRAMIEVNVLGAMAWLNQAAVRFERAGGGHIVGIGSIAGDRGRRGMPAYHTSKAAFHTYLESLRNRLSQHGVTVTTIKPGMVETSMLDDVDKKIMPITAPDAAAQIMKAIERKKQTVYIPFQWGLISLIIRHIPSIIFRRLSF
jgi:short-subunit dehydrogenase